MVGGDYLASVVMSEQHISKNSSIWWGLPAVDEMAAELPVLTASESATSNDGPTSNRHRQTASQHTVNAELNITSVTFTAWQQDMWARLAETVDLQSQMKAKPQTHTYRQRHTQTDVQIGRRTYRETDIQTWRIVSRASHTSYSHTLDTGSIWVIGDVKTLEVQQVVLLINLVQLETHLHLAHTHRHLIDGMAPQYLNQLVPVSSLPGRCPLQSSFTLQLQFRLSTASCRSFPVATSILEHSARRRAVSSFRWQLKTFLFHQSFPDTLV